MRKAAVETGAASLTCILSLLGLFEAWRYGGEGGLLPRAVMMFLVLLSAIWIIQSLVALSRGPAVMIAPSPQQLRLAAVLVTAGLALIFGMSKLGFYTTATLVVPLTAYALGYRQLKVIALGTALFLAILIAVFHYLLSVPLPREILLDLFGG